MAMRIICAWCPKDLGAVQDLDDTVTHGVCKPCYDRVMDEIQAKKSELRGSHATPDKEPAKTGQE